MGYWLGSKFYNTSSEIPLETLHTKQLLQLLRGTYGSDPYDETVGDTEFQERLKAVLATREHVPNKQESKKARQERAKRGH